jgi:hypothetical protein
VVDHVCSNFAGDNYRGNMILNWIRFSLKGFIFSALLLCSLVSAQAVVTTLSFSPNPADLNDLDHHMVYTWRLNNLPTTTITSATLTIKNIANWDSNANTLFIHLLDTSKNGGVSSFVDDTTNSVPVTDITDDFANTRYHSDPAWLVAAGTGDKKLTQQSFGTTPTNYTYTFTTSALSKLNTYIANGGDIAFGFDPDCHYFNDGITFSFQTNIPNISPVPEAQAFVPLAAVIGLAIANSRIRRNRESIS